MAIAKYQFLHDRLVGYGATSVCGYILHRDLGWSNWRIAIDWAIAANQHLCWVGWRSIGNSANIESVPFMLFYGDRSPVKCLILIMIADPKPSDCVT
jgi:hypothetical protein